MKAQIFSQLTAQTEVTLAIVCYSFCSGTLVLLNKLILHFLPYPSLVISFQLAAAILFIYTAKFTGALEVDPIKWQFVLPYLAYTVAFSLGVYCNMRSLSISNVETVIVFRALTPVLVAFLDYMFLGRELPSNRSWSALFIIVLGAYGYASFDEKFQTQGMSAYMWPSFYLLIISFEMVCSFIVCGHFFGVMCLRLSNNGNSYVSYFLLLTLLIVLRKTDYSQRGSHDIIRSSFIHQLVGHLPHAHVCFGW
jgi:drug/metabolite transporter (DMT)-like permease